MRRRRKRRPPNRDQLELIPPKRRRPRILDGEEAPPRSHSDGPGTERAAARKIAPSVKTIRAQVERMAFESGIAGLIPWDAIVAFRMEERETSVRPRFTELKSEEHGCALIATAWWRVSGKGLDGSPEQIIVHREHYDRRIHESKRRYGRDGRRVS